MKGLGRLQGVRGRNAALLGASLAFLAVLTLTLWLSSCEKAGGGSDVPVAGQKVEETRPIGETTGQERSTQDTAGQQQMEQPPAWNRPRFEERREQRERMVREQIAAPGREVKDARVLEAMRQVPRHRFVPTSYGFTAYADSALPIGHGQTISQPYIVAMMTELLQVEPGERVLEIGTGSGYQAAVLSELTPHVYSIEIVEVLCERASELLAKLGYETINVKTGDGYFGWEEHGPFEGIIVTCAAGHVPPPLLEQLKPGGRMVVPVGGAYETQYLILVTKDEGGELRSEQILPVRFVPMTGRIQERK